MHAKLGIVVLGLATVVAGCTTPAQPAGLGAPALPSEALEAIPFLNHIQFGVFEQDIYVERPGDASGVYRVTPSDAAKPEVLRGAIYASATGNPHDVTFQNTGPFAKGDPLPFTLERWLAARGSAAYLCTEGQHARVDARFTGLVPQGVYTFWDAKLTLAEGALTAAQDLPIGSRDGSQATFVADQDGNGHFEVAWDGCLEPSTAGPGLGPTGQATAFALAWHRDGKTYGASPGPFGQQTHLQLFGLVEGAR